jgi:hypothetical protein
VATIRANGDARRSWRMISRWVSAPSSVLTPMPMAQASATFHPRVTSISHAT